MVLPVGAMVNAGAVAAGAGLGLMAGSLINEKLRDSLFQVLGFCSLLIGLQMALSATNLLVVILSSVLGMVTGEVMRLSDRLTTAGDTFKRLVRSQNEKFTEGLVTSTMIICIGAMGIVGSLEEGLGGGRAIIYSKSILDFCITMMLATAYGSGVLASALPLLIYQGAWTLFASVVAPYLTEPIKMAIVGTGGLMIAGIGTNLIGVKPMNISNLLPALIYAVILGAILGS